MALGGFLTPTPNVRLLIVWAPVVATVFVTSVILPRVGQTARIAYGIMVDHERDHILKSEPRFIWPASTRFRL
jgi:hypothetical protein